MVSDLQLVASILEVTGELERMADRVTNICERAIYVVTAEMKELEPPEDDLLN